MIAWKGRKRVCSIRPRAYGRQPLVDRFSASLGLRLRSARRQRGWSLGELESYTGGEFKASVVGAYERGERALSVQRLVRLAEIFAVPAADLAQSLYRKLAADSKDGDLIDRYLAAIHFLRREGSPDEVRDSDKAVIASLLDSTVEVASGSD